MQKALLYSARSRCDICDRRLGAVDVIPVAGWLVQRGKCRSCSAPISALYPLIEFGALLASAWAVYHTQGIITWVSVGLGCVLLTLAAQDYRYQILGDVFTFPLLLVGLLTSSLWSDAPWWHHVFGAAIGFLSLWGINVVYKRLRHRDGIGLGDAKLFGAAGAWLTYSGLPSTLLYATVSACIAVIVGAIFGFELNRMTRVPFGIFLCFGFWLTWLYGPLELGGAG